MEFTQQQLRAFYQANQASGSDFAAYQQKIDNIYPVRKVAGYVDGVVILAVGNKLVAWFNEVTHAEWFINRTDTILDRMSTLLSEFNDLPFTVDEATRVRGFNPDDPIHTRNLIVNMSCSYSRILTLRQILIDAGIRQHPELDSDSDFNSY